MIWAEFRCINNKWFNRHCHFKDSYSRKKLKQNSVDQSCQSCVQFTFCWLNVKAISQIETCLVTINCSVYWTDVKIILVLILHLFRCYHSTHANLEFSVLGVNNQFFKTISWFGFHLSFHLCANWSNHANTLDWHFSTVCQVTTAKVSFQFDLLLRIYYAFWARAIVYMKNFHLKLQRLNCMRVDGNWKKSNSSWFHWFFSPASAEKKLQISSVGK